jgi:RalA-binding protein 1
MPPPPASAPSTLNTPFSQPTTVSQKQPPTPLVVSNLPFPTSSTQSTSPLLKSASTQDRSSVRDGGAGHNEIRPLTYPRKSSLVGSINSGISTSPSTETSGRRSCSVDRMLSTVPQLVTTPASSPNPPIVTGLPTPDGMLSAASGGSRPQLLSRESRVSLPDEAKQYIANMTDSPVTSPLIDAFVAKFGPTPRGGHPQSQIPETTDGPIFSRAISEEDSPGGTKEFLDMRDEEDEDEDGDDDESDITVPDADADGETLFVSSPRESQVQEPQQSELSGNLQERHDNPHPTVDEFPLPPSNPQLQGQQVVTQAQMLQQAHMHGYTTSQIRHPNPVLMTSADARHQQPLNSAPPSYTSADRLETPQFLGQSHQHQQSSHMDSHQQPLQTVPASFRALPLLPSDLLHTTIAVSHSFVRPNDRGKEVLSFIVCVDPGQGKGGWKVEKMYSDVLGLDQRVRSSVAKGIGKKIANLPEGKLWKDHAPAKVDQRKVRSVSLYSPNFS